MPVTARKKAAPLAPRKAPRQQRSAQTVAAIVEAAAQVLESDGRDGFNTNAVAMRAGVSVGSLYQYFRSKDALIVALLRREEDRFVDDCARAAGATSGREALVVFIEAGVRQQLARPRLARLLDVEEARPEIGRATTGKRGLHEILVALLGRDDLPRQADLERAARDIGAVLRALTDSAGERGESDRRGLRRRIEAAVFGYLQNMQKPKRKTATPSGDATSVRNASKSPRSASSRRQVSDETGKALGEKRPAMRVVGRE